MKSETVTYELFCNKIQEMVQNNEKLSVRNVMSKTGGAPDKISNYLKRWHEEQRLKATLKKDDISAELKHAILIEKGKAVSEVTTVFENHIQQIENQLQEVNDILKEQEAVLSTKTKELDTAKEQIISLSQSNRDYQEQLKALEEKLENAIKLQGQAVTESAKAQLQLDRADASALEAKQQLAKKEELLSTMIEEKHTAEKNAAVWEAKYEQLKQQFDAVMAKVRT